MLAVLTAAESTNYDDDRDDECNVDVNVNTSRQGADRPEAADSIDTCGAVLTSEVGSSERGTLVDVLVTVRSLPAWSTLTEESVELVDARGSVTTWITDTFVHRQQLHAAHSLFNELRPLPRNGWIVCICICMCYVLCVL